MLYIEEIFTSIDGEVNIRGQGTLTTFLRLSGCNFSCLYCDSAHTIQRNDNAVSVESVAEKIKELGCKNLTITGGEPLIQKKELVELLELLSKGEKYQITIETNGSISLLGEYAFNGSLTYVVDYKLEYARQMKWSVFDSLLSGDWIKIPIRNRSEYEKATLIVRSIQLNNNKPKIAFSPINGETGDLTAKQLMEWLIEDKLFHIHVNCQLHKLIDVS